SYSADWRPEEWRLGAAKVFAILASSFEEVLFLDPDNFVIRDPTYLFETRTYRKYGSIFWPDFPIRKSGIGVWDILEMEGRFWRELEFETGQIVINKRASWRGLIMAMHISAEARFYFRHFLGDKEAFFWGYAASQTPYYLAPNYIHSVGLIVSDEYPRGNSTVGIDKKNRFCGLSMLQSDFPDNGPSTNRTNFPQPLFMHWNMVKKNQYKSDVNYFQSAMTYDLQAGVHAADIENVNYNFVGEVGQFKHCVSIWPVKGGPVRSWGEIG
ncbi:mannosyltransferase putative-domain-containing protein, partial [Zopfochytrium polystomum]